MRGRGVGPPAPASPESTLGGLDRGRQARAVERGDDHQPGGHASGCGAHYFERPLRVDRTRCALAQSQDAESHRRGIDRSYGKPQEATRSYIRRQAAVQQARELVDELQCLRLL